MSIVKEFEQNPKFSQIIKTAHELFYRFGIKRVTIEEICREANVSKMTFYKFFPNKSELAKYLIQSIFDNAIQEYQDIIDSEDPFPEKLKALMELKRHSTDKIGIEFMSELLKNPEPDIEKIYSQQRQRSMTITMNFLRNAQERGDIRPNIKLEFILYMLNKMIDMSTDETLAHLYNSPQDIALEMTSFFFYGILNRD